MINLESGGKRSSDVFEYVLDKKAINDEPIRMKSPKRKNKRKQSITNVGAEEYIRDEESGYIWNGEYANLLSSYVFTMILIILKWIVFYVRSKKK